MSNQSYRPAQEAGMAPPVPSSPNSTWESMSAVPLARMSTAQCHTGHHQSPTLGPSPFAGFGTGADNSSLLSMLLQRPREPLPELSTPESLDRYAQIAANPDGVARNLDITLAYHEVSNQMDRALFRNPEEQGRTANWTTFAVWASNEAGRAIRGEGNWVADAGNWLGGTSVGQGLGVDDQLRHTQTALADGNREVFAEIAPAFAMFAHNFGSDSARDPRKFEAFAEWMRTQAPNRDPNLGNESLIQAFSAYHEAMFETNADRKQELILMANALVGMHEQTRLQPHIENAMPWAARGFLTEHAMSLHTPNISSGAAGLDFSQNYDELDLSEGLPTAPGRPRTWYGGVDTPYSEPLRNLDDPQVARTLDQVDGNWLLDDGAANWANYGDRMDYIAELFRTRQDDARLHVAPFTEEQKQQKLRELGR